jgi:hypothetical protein
MRKHALYLRFTFYEVVQNVFQIQAYFKVKLDKHNHREITITHPRK